MPTGEGSPTAERKPRAQTTVPALTVAVLAGDQNPRLPADRLRIAVGRTVLPPGPE